MKRRRTSKGTKRAALVRLGGHLYRVELVQRPRVTDAAPGRKRRRKRKGRR